MKRNPQPEGAVSPEKLAAEKLAWEYDAQLAEVEREHGRFPADTMPTPDCSFPTIRICATPRCKVEVPITATYCDDHEEAK